MSTLKAFSCGYRVDDGDIGYAGGTHLPFKPRAMPTFAVTKAFFLERSH
jgi:hypothetical protein